MGKIFDKFNFFCMTKFQDPIIIFYIPGVQLSNASLQRDMKAKNHTLLEII